MFSTSNLILKRGLGKIEISRVFNFRLNGSMNVSGSTRSSVDATDKITKLFRVSIGFRFEFRLGSVDATDKITKLFRV